MVWDGTAQEVSRCRDFVEGLSHLAPFLSAEARLLAKADAGRGRIAKQSG